MKAIRIGIMGFGQVGRQIYKLTLEDERFDVAAISDIGKPEILCHLLNKAMGPGGSVMLKNNYLVSDRMQTRLMPADHPTDIPWDVFDVDVVVDATGRFRTADELEPHIANGARRVVTSALPEGNIDRVVLYGVNQDQAKSSDRIVSAGSASTTATVLALKTISDAYEIEHVSMTSVHAYTSDQSLQDYAGADYRRSRSGAENIIPNDTPALHWVQQVLPMMQGRMTAYALNVPVQTGSMLDITFALATSNLNLDSIKNLFVQAADENPELIGVTNDPIVSSDVKGIPYSLLVDLDGCMLAGNSFVKVLAWHETQGHARRILDVVATYAQLDENQYKEAS